MGSAQELKLDSEDSGNLGSSQGRMYCSSLQSRKLPGLQSREQTKRGLEARGPV